jgi:hypothetical protein
MSLSLVVVVVVAHQPLLVAVVLVDIVRLLLVSSLVAVFTLKAN